MLAGVNNVMDLTHAQKVEALCLFFESAKLAHLQVVIVDDKGNILIQLKDLDGKLLATINSTKDMVKVEKFQKIVNSLKLAVEAKRELNATGKFVPMPNAEMPNTASHEQTYMLIGGLFVLLGVAALVPAVRLDRKVEEEA